MLQIAIWGICIMLVVKALEMMQRQALAKHPEQGAVGFTTAATVIAIIGAVLLFLMASAQVSDMPTTTPFGGY
ncbi:MAG: hypothetical protein ABIT16_09805 [Croceibacterium sp.]